MSTRTVLWSSGLCHRTVLWSSGLCQRVVSVCKREFKKEREREGGRAWGTGGWDHQDLSIIGPLAHNCIR